MNEKGRIIHEMAVKRYFLTTYLLYGDFVKLPVKGAEDFFVCREYWRNDKEPFEETLIATKTYRDDGILRKSISPIHNLRNFFVVPGENNLPCKMFKQGFKFCFYYSEHSRLIYYTKETNGEIVEAIAPQCDKEGFLTELKSSIKGNSIKVSYDKNKFPNQGLQTMRKIVAFMLDEDGRPEFIYFESGPRIRYEYSEK